MAEFRYDEKLNKLDETLKKLDRHPASQRFHDLLKEIGELHDRKQADYGTHDNPFANLEASTEWGVRPFVATLVRMADKFRRLATYVLTGKLANEGVIDSLKDIAVYAIADIILFEKERSAIDAVNEGLKW